VSPVDKQGGRAHGCAWPAATSSTSGRFYPSHGAFASKRSMDIFDALYSFRPKSEGAPLRWSSEAYNTVSIMEKTGFQTGAELLIPTTADIRSVLFGSGFFKRGNASSGARAILSALGCASPYQKRIAAAQVYVEYFTGTAFRCNSSSGGRASGASA